jgi:hypothetical protein
MTLEYRRIGRLPTCIGNERIRITGDGEVSHSRNTVECEPGAEWSASWRPVGKLDAAAMARLTQQIIDTRVLESDPESIDETAEGGTRQEMDIAIGEREHHFVAENTDPAPFRAAVRLLWGVMFELEPRSHGGNTPSSR